MGLIAGATSEAFNRADEIGEMAKRAAVTGAVGGLAAAAAGGSEEDIRKGFLYSGGMVLVKGAYSEYTQHELNPKSSNDEAYTKIQTREDAMLRLGDPDSPPDAAYLRDPKGNIIYDGNGFACLDQSKFDPNRPHVGMADTPQGMGILGEKSGLMTGLSRVPGVNAMAVFHDQWAINWRMASPELQLTIPPAIVFTYLGTIGPAQNVILESGKEQADPTDKK